MEWYAMLCYPMRFELLRIQKRSKQFDVKYYGGYGFFSSDSIPNKERILEWGRLPQEFKKVCMKLV